MTPFRYLMQNLCYGLIAGAIIGSPAVDAGPNFNQAIEKMSVQHAPIILKQGNTRAAVLAEFQGRVMVTTANGDEGHTLGWANFDYLQQPNTNNNSATGGASRLWFGPETGPYSMFFKPDKARTVENIYVQDAISLNPFSLSSRTPSTAIFKQNISMQNNLGFTFELAIEREITLFSQQQVAKTLNIDLGQNLQMVGFGALTKMTNIGKVDWQKDSGLLSLWELGAFEPSDTTTVFMPITGELDKVTSYFTPIKDTHTRIQNGVVYYNADANYMNKMGIPAKNSQALIGSYDSQAKLLTVFQYQLNGANELYNNSVWYEDNYQPYGGDIINIFNDGLVDGGERFGPFYEVETSSSARALKVNESHQHFQNTFHFQGDEKSLDAITQSLFGMSLTTVKSVFSDIK